LHQNFEQAVVVRARRALLCLRVDHQGKFTACALCIAL
jgi:hypothetical protein